MTRLYRHILLFCLCFYHFGLGGYEPRGWGVRIAPGAPKFWPSAQHPYKHFLRRFRNRRRKLTSRLLQNSRSSSNQNAAQEEFELLFGAGLHDDQ
jgi:hypothetical protein